MDMSPLRLCREVIDEKELAEEEQTLENLEDEIVEYDHQLVEQRAEFECLAPKEIKRAGAGISRNQITQGAAASQAEVMFDEDGNIVLNEDTLVSHVDDSIPGFNPDQPMDIVYEDDEHVRMSYHSYATWQRADKWTTSDTLAFYDAIKIFGSDFTFIHQKFPKRSRGQIRNKFKREEKTNRELIDKLLAEHVEVSRKLTSAISALPEFGILKDNIRSTDEYHTLKPDDSAFGAFKNDKDANGDLISENRGGVYIPELDMAMLDGF
ncbi:hypothetical protein SARC_01908 [Sphaeroforma arctica JP610]|uniref:SANT domain-containing protein n=1 Tax=Sphaeroforma arctica JP610 TaxID=667725 RepID=A0A0L0GA89_9EUKA|nr:hypothetical protein SARC_01908 [Sphaeroforma arctica JP610]KNC85915.1 hypothetical protein SARC_01908 [Sphaeroforma arctica JP610]|eukprot:XP_014159817.1 hypothetical protein SARC_01908 [Sphaeroforma arctica JP610]